MPGFPDNTSSATLHWCLNAHIVQKCMLHNQSQNIHKGEISCWVQLRVRWRKARLRLSLIKVPSTPCTSGYVASLASDARYVSMPRSSIFDNRARKYLWPTCYRKFRVTRRVLSKCKPLALPFQTDGYVQVTFPVFASLKFTASVNHRQYGNSRNLIRVSPVMTYLPTFTVAPVNRLMSLQLYYICTLKFIGFTYLQLCSHIKNIQVNNPSWLTMKSKKL